MIDLGKKYWILKNIENENPQLKINIKEKYIKIF